MSFKITFWGVRGSLPSAATPQQQIEEIKEIMKGFFASGLKDPTQIDAYLKSMPVPKAGSFGSSTTCAEVEAADSRVIIDCGSGIRRLGEKLMKGPCGKGQGVVHILMTHFHWDHLIGLPFFTPIFIPGNEVHFYAVQPELEKMIRGKFQKPYFPVPYEALPSKIFFHVIEPRKRIVLGDINVTPYQLDHPDPCWGFKVEADGKAYAHCVDSEGTRISRDDLGPDLPLYQGVDLMYFDAQYTLPELAEKANWGHSAAQLGIDLAMREGIKKVLFAHHDPGASTAQIYRLVKQTQEYYDWKMQTASTNRTKFTKVDWQFAYEGLEIIL